MRTASQIIVFEGDAFQALAVEAVTLDDDVLQAPHPSQSVVAGGVRLGYRGGCWDNGMATCPARQVVWQDGTRESGFVMPKSLLPPQGTPVQLGVAEDGTMVWRVKP